MTNLPPPDRQKSQLSLDEWIGIIVAFSTIGAILIWILAPRAHRFDLKQLIGSPTSEEKNKETADLAATTPSPAEIASPQPTAIAPPPTSPSPLTPLPTSPSLPAQKLNTSSTTLPLTPIPSTPTAETPTPTPTPKVSFVDVADDYWASPYIQALVSRDIMKGFPDNTFKPNSSINRAEFAALLNRAFQQKPTLSAPNFKDISTDFWGFPAIQETTKTGFLRGYPGNTFKPTQPIPKVQVLVALASGLDLPTSKTPQTILQKYQDAAQIPKYATQKVSAATEAGIVVNYPNSQLLNPNKDVTRAEVAALIYQALVKAGKAEAIPSEYLVKP